MCVENVVLFWHKFVTEKLLIPNMAKVIITTTDSEDEIESSSGEMEVEEFDSNKDNASCSSSKGLANVMAKILSSSVAGEKVPILANAKSDKELMKKQKQKAIEKSLPLNKKFKASDGTEEDVVSFESTSKAKDAGVDEDDVSLSAQQHREKMLEKKLWEEMCHARAPFSPTDLEKSRRLKRIATKGVVKLFNSVLQHQTLVKEKLKKVGTTESKREKVMGSVSKGEFIDKLKDKKKKTHDDESIKAEIKEEPMDEQEQIWDVLRDDFMMKPNMKDWDKKDNSDDDDDNKFDSGSESD